MVTAIVGVNWGDEGKGRMVDYFASKADCVIRYQGGDNAGHTVINDYGKLVFHNFPCGISYKNVVNIIAPGSVINLESFLNEMETLNSKGVETQNIMISDRAVLILPFHILLDKLEEERLKDKPYGSTLSGIAPVYGERFMKKGIQVGELLHPEYLKDHLASIVEYNNLIFTQVYKVKPIDFEETYRLLMGFGEKLNQYIFDIRPIINEMLQGNKKIVIEAQLGALRDIIHGIYPYTTSSSTLAGYACASIPIPADAIKNIIGVTKAYSTCVGEGPFVTEIKDTLGDDIRNKAGEFGATTGRPRRIGYFDAVASRYGCEVQGVTSLTLTCLDVLSGYAELKICTAYETHGNKTEIFPLNAALEKASPVYEILPGWIEDITAVRDYSNLPLNAKKYVERIEHLLSTEIKYISVGPERNALIVR